MAVITIPSTPSAPQAIDVSIVSITSSNTSPFTGQQQVYSWNSQYKEFRVHMPPMAYSTFQPWIAFLAALEGQANTFEFGSAVQAAWPNDFGSGVFWRL